MYIQLYSQQENINSYLISIEILSFSTEIFYSH